jgi:anti-sigma factor RsiW
MTWPQRTSCERSRLLAALAPDGMLSELEQRSLERHIRRCGACASFAASVTATTEQLRRAELEPLPLGFSAASGMPRRGRGPMRIAGLTGAVATALLALFLVHDATLSVHGVAPPVLIQNARPENESAVLRQIRDGLLSTRYLESDTRTGRPGMFA